jgi:hypothetical protein
MPNIDISKLTDDQKQALIAAGIDISASSSGALTLEDVAKKPADTWTPEEYQMLRDDFLAKLPPELRNRPEYYPIGSKKADGSPLGFPSQKVHSASRIGAAALNDDANLVLVACGQITGANPPTVLGKPYNWGSLTRTGAGAYNITLGTAAPANTAAEQWTFWYRTVAAGLPCILVTDTSDTVKAFTVKDNNVAVDTMVFGFALWRQPFTS